MADLNRLTNEPLGRSLLVIAGDLEPALDLGRLAHETCVVDADDPASLPDELFDNVVVQTAGQLDGLLSQAQARTATGGAVLVDAKSGGRLGDGGWQAIDVVDVGPGMCLVQVEPTVADNSEGLNLLLRATGQACASSDDGHDPSWTIRSRALARQPTKSLAVPPGVAVDRPATAAPVQRQSGPRRTGWRKVAPEMLASSGPDFGRRAAVLVLAGILWTLLGVLVAGMTGIGWLAVALWVIVGLQLGQLAQSEIARRSLKRMIMRSSTRR